MWSGEARFHGGGPMLRIAGSRQRAAGSKEKRDRQYQLLGCLLPAAYCLLLSGCETPSWFRKPERDPIESVVFRDGKVVPVDPVAMRSTPELAAAHELYRDGKYGKA